MYIYKTKAQPEKFSRTKSVSFDFTYCVKISVRSDQ